LDLLAEMNGFTIVSTEEFMSGAIPSENTWSICLVLRKNIV